MVEQCAVNALVVGSNPSPGDLGSMPEWSKGADCKSVDFGLRWFESNCSHFADIAQLAEHLICNQTVGSSILSVSRILIKSVFKPDSPILDQYIPE